MAVIRKIKLPSEAAARDVGALSSNVIYDGDSGVTTTLNQKIQSISSPDLSNYVTKAEFNSGMATKSGFEVATTTTAGLMSAQDKEDLDRLKISGSTPVTISGDQEVEVTDAAAEAVQAFLISLEPNVSIIPGKNLANPETNIQGYYISANGTITAQAGDWYTELIPVEPGDHIYVSGYHNQSDNGNKRLHGYNANGTWNRQLTFAAVPAKSTLPAYYACDATVPSGVAYIRFSYRMQDTSVMVQKNTNDPYEPYGEIYQFDDYNAPLSIVKTGESTTTYQLAIPDMYAGLIDVLTGTVNFTWGHIASYNGEVLPGEWWSTYEKSTTASSPTIGSEVIYELATPVVSSITALSLTTDEGYNRFNISEGTIDTFTYGAKGSVISNLNITSGIITLGATSLSEHQLQQLLQLLN